MRRIALTLALAALAVGFAPAPLSKRDRETAQQKSERERAECARRLSDLGVKWSVVTGPGGQRVRYSVEVLQPNRFGGMSGELDATGDLVGAMRHLIRIAGAFVRNEGIVY